MLSSVPSLIAILSSPPRQIPHPVRAAQRQLLPLHHCRGLPPKRKEASRHRVPLPLAVLPLSLCPVTSVHPTHGPGTAWVMVSPLGPCTPSCPHPAVATAPSPLCHILPRIPKPDLSQAGGQCPPLSPCPVPSCPHGTRGSHHLEFPVVLAPCASGGAAVPAFSGAGGGNWRDVAPAEDAPRL